MRKKIISLSKVPYTFLRKAAAVSRLVEVIFFIPPGDWTRMTCQLINIREGKVSLWLLQQVCLLFNHVLVSHSTELLIQKSYKLNRDESSTTNQQNKPV